MSWRAADHAAESRACAEADFELMVFEHGGDTIIQIYFVFLVSRLSYETVHMQCDTQREGKRPKIALQASSNVFESVLQHSSGKKIHVETHLAVVDAI